MEFRASIANPDQYWEGLAPRYGDPVPLWRFDFGAYGSIHIYVWGQDLHEALETAAAYGEEVGYGIFEEPEWDEAREELIDRGNTNPTEEEIHTAATVDMTYTESGYIGHDWAYAEILPDSSEYQQVALASQLSEVKGEQNRIVVDPQKEVWDDWSPGTYNYGMLPFITTWLRRFCDYLLPVQLYPQFEIGEDYITQWVVIVACEQNQEYAIAELGKLNERLNDFSSIASTLEVAPVEEAEWVRVGESEPHYSHEQDLEPQEYVPRYRVTFTITVSPYRRPFQIQFIFVARRYEPEFFEFEDE